MFGDRGSPSTWFVSRYVNICFRSGVRITPQMSFRKTGFVIALLFSFFSSFGSLRNCYHCRTGKNTCLDLAVQLAEGCLVPCLRYRLPNLVPVVWHRQMNWIQMCLGLYARLKKLTRQSFTVVWDTFI